jgi:hypothetical protein
MEVGQGPNWECSAKKKKKMAINFYSVHGCDCFEMMTKHKLC